MGRVNLTLVAIYLSVIVLLGALAGVILATAQRLFSPMEGSTLIAMLLVALTCGIGLIAAAHYSKRHP